MSDPMEFSRHFKELIFGETQAAVARKLGFVQSRVSQIARGEKPSRDFVERLVEVYELDRDLWLQRAGFAPRPPVEDEDERLRRILREELRPTADTAAAQLLDAAELEYERADDPVTSFGYEGLPPDLPPAARLAIGKILDASRKKARRLAE